MGVPSQKGDRHLSEMARALRCDPIWTRRRALCSISAARLRELRAIGVADLADGTVHAQVALFDPHGARADAFHLLD